MPQQTVFLFIERLLKMSQEILKVEKIHVKVQDKEILKGLDLEIGEGETHVIMGPNGAGKSTLGNTLMGKMYLMYLFS